MLLVDFAAATRLLKRAKGRGWSSPDHPGHLLSPLFVRLLGGAELQREPERDLGELSLLSEREGPRLATATIDDLVRLAGVRAPIAPEARATVVESMRTAAEKRLAGVTENTRRRHYAHAASLALACAQVDDSTAGVEWLASIRNRYRRYPALQREFDDLGAVDRISRTEADL